MYYVILEPLNVLLLIIPRFDIRNLDHPASDLRLLLVYIVESRIELRKLSDVFLSIYLI